MARLSAEQLIELIKKPRNEAFINQAIEQEQRLTMHIEPILEYQNMPFRAKNRFINWVRSFLQPDKWDRFNQMLTMPVDTVMSTKAIFHELGKFMDAQDRFVKFDFINEAIQNDFLSYCEQSGDPDFWRTHAMDALKTGICSYLVIDLPAKQTTKRPEPYCYVLGIAHVRDVEIDEYKGKVEYILFHENGDDNTVIGIEDEYYRRFKKQPNGEWLLSDDAQHSTYSEGGELLDGLGYAPVIDFYGKAIKGTRGIVKNGPVTPALGKLDFLLYNRTARKCLELYGPWPIIASYHFKCTYKDAKNNVCQGGVVNTGEFDETTGKPATYKCPACSKAQLIGPGIAVEVDMPADGSMTNPLTDGPIKIIEAPVDSLNFVKEMVQEQEDTIFLECVGEDGDAMSTKAINENQVSANFESKQAVLNTIKEQFERVHKFVGDTKALLRYNRSYFVSSTVDYGNDFFLKTAEQITDEYGKAKTAGMPISYLSTLREQATATKFKNNPDQLARQKILLDLEPYPDVPLTQLTTLQINIADPLAYVVKLNFYTFIKKFERENIDIVTFGALTSYKEKINSIQSTLYEYAKRQLAEAAGTQLDPSAEKRTASSAA